MAEGYSALDNAGFEAASDWPLHVQLGHPPTVVAQPDGRELVYHAPEALR